MLHSKKSFGTRFNAAAIRASFIAGLLFSTMTIGALAEDNDADYVSTEILQACADSLNICYLSCRAAATEELTDDVCVAGCDDAWLQCEASVEFRQKAGSAGGPGNGPLEQDNEPTSGSGANSNSQMTLQLNLLQ